MSIADGLYENSSVLLELSAVDDLTGFKRAIEEDGYDVDEPILWYGRRIGSNKMGYEERTPLMIAAMFGSQDVVKYILQTGRVNPSRACGSDGATALHCAVAGGCNGSVEIVKLLIEAHADINCVDANGNKPAHVVDFRSSSLRKKTLEMMLKCEKKEYPVDHSLPDIKNGIYITDEFRMYTFKVTPCSRAYSHDWTECPFVHPGENARRRDPRKYQYSCVPCPEFRKGCCSKGDCCEYAHGIFESWLHPAQYRTRLCKDEGHCTRRVCFFAHKVEELRPVYASTGSAVQSPLSMSAIGSPNCSPMWRNGMNTVALPTLQLAGGLERRRQQLLEELANLDQQVYGSPTGIRRIDRLSGLCSSTMTPSRLSDWGLPDGKLQEGPIRSDSPDVSWLNSLFNDPSEIIPSWADLFYTDQHQMVA